MTEAALIEDIRIRAAALHRRESYRVGSDMVAYANIAAALGRSSSWLRQFIGRQSGVSVSYVAGMNIRLMYERVCERIETSAERMENAAHKGDRAMAKSLVQRQEGRHEKEMKRTSKLQQVHPLQTFRDTQQPPLSQEQLADLLGVSRVAVTRWESGRRKISQRLLPKVARKTGIPVAYLRPDLAQIMRAEAAE